jgi:tetratricopeptide (TPR) repeat protein
MCRTTRFWKGAGALAVGGLLLSGGWAWAGSDPAPVPDQLLKLARQAEAAGQSADALAFYRQILKVDPEHAVARQAITRGAVRRVSLVQEPAEVPPAPGPMPEEPPAPEPEAVPTPSPASLEEADRLNNVEAERLTADVNGRLARARNLINQGQAAQALDELRLAIQAVKGDTAAPLDVRNALERRLQVEYRSALRREEAQEQAEAQRVRLEAAAEQEQRALAELTRRQDTAKALMTQFDTLMETGYYDILYSGGLGDIDKNTAPFFDARILANHARALEPNHPAPRAGIFVASALQFYAQALAYEEIKEYRYQLSMNDVLRAGVPFPDTKIIEYPDVEFFRRITEQRRSRYEVVSLEDTDEKTQGIRRKLEQIYSFPFDVDTPLEEVVKYIQTQTVDDQFPRGIPIYLDEVGMEEANNVTAASTVKIALEGVPLKTILRLMLKQLGLTFTVTNGVLTITSPEGVNEQTEIRVYPVADLSVIPANIFGFGGGGGGGMGGMGGGGFGGGMGGMGGGGMGGMGGMGGGGFGGMGGMGGGGFGGGGFRSIPAEPPAADLVPPAQEKKSR